MNEISLSFCSNFRSFYETHLWLFELCFSFMEHLNNFIILRVPHLFGFVSKCFIPEFLCRAHKLSHDINPDTWSEKKQQTNFGLRSHRSMLKFWIRPIAWQEYRFETNNLKSLRPQPWCVPPCSRTNESKKENEKQQQSIKLNWELSVMVCVIRKTGYIYISEISVWVHLWVRARNPDNVCYGRCHRLHHRNDLHEQRKRVSIPIATQATIHVLNFCAHARRDLVPRTISKPFLSSHPPFLSFCMNRLVWCNSRLNSACTLNTIYIDPFLSIPNVNIRVGGFLHLLR